MEIKVQKESLQNAVNACMRSVPTKSSMPILECILITVENDEARFTATDSETEVDVFLNDIDIITSGKVAVDSKIFSPIVQKLPNNEVIIKVEENNMLVTSGRAKFNIPVRDGEEYPFMDSVKLDRGIMLTQGELKELIRQTIFSCSVNDGNRIMTGCLFSLTGEKLKIVALDGHRVAIREIELDHDYEDVNVIIPAKTLQSISRILGEGDIDIFFSENMAAFKFDNILITSRLIDGTFFEIGQMLNNDYITEMTVNNDELTACLERALLLISGQDRKPVIFNITDNSLETEMTTNMGSSTESLEIVKTGNDIRIGFNPLFIADALRVVDDEEVKFCFSGEKAPCYIKGDGYTYLILPIQIPG